MPTVADLHIHSRYSLATSDKLRSTYSERWARIKGIRLLGTGDCTHPKWLAELKESLEPAEEGFFRLKDELRREFDSGEALAEGLPEPRPEPGESGDASPRFVLTGEICTIYRKDGKTRKVHHLVILPGFEAAQAFQERLEKVGNISSDGRPILGIDSRDLFYLLLDADDRSILVPAHIWTPWFSALGGRSGFDSIDECYGDLAPRIGAIETGLSSNPPMNWALSSLDRFAIISNSDAHSPEKLCREATVIDMEMSFAGLSDALSGSGRTRERSRGEILETVEFFPQEGKYHYDGHRACGVVLDPEESAAALGICPVCGKALTPGVLRRVRELADRPVDEEAPCPGDAADTNKRPYLSLIPLKELVAELLESGEGSKKVGAAYNALIAKAESELRLLTEMRLSEIELLCVPGLSGELLAEAIGRMRSGKVSIKPGYDGEYGIIRAFAPGERIEGRAEKALFDSGIDATTIKADVGTNAKPRKAKRLKGGKGKAIPANASDDTGSPRDFKLEPAQECAVAHESGPALVIAGPGTGKTAVLALRVERLVTGSAAKAGLDPSAIFALTFTNKAAGELRARLGRTLGEGKAAAIAASTFHSCCRALLSENAAQAGLEPDFKLLDEDERYAILEPIAGSTAKAKRLGAYIEARKRFLLRPGDAAPPLGPAAPAGLAELAKELGVPDSDTELETQYAAYRDALKQKGALDFADLLAGAVRLLASRPAILQACRERFKAVFVDEYQDVDFAQYALVRLLAPDDASDLFVIGDPNQAIYGFRGADKRFIDRFLVDYPGAVVYRLTRSFRCAPSIIDAASGIVGAAGLEGSGTAVALARSEYPTDKSEAEAIAREIDRLIAAPAFSLATRGSRSPRRGSSRASPNARFSPARLFSSNRSRRRSTTTAYPTVSLAKIRRRLTRYDRNESRS